MTTDNDTTTRRLRDTVTPYATYVVTAAEIGSRDDVLLWCEYCADGNENAGSHTHYIYVTREGASHRTADELARLFADDVEDLVEGYNVPEDLPAPDGWCDDPDDSQYLSDEIRDAESTLADVGLQVSWDDGYVIERVTEDDTTDSDDNGAPVYVNPDGTVCTGGDACTGDCLKKGEALK